MNMDSGDPTSSGNFEPALERENVLAFLISHKKKLVADGFRERGHRVNWRSRKKQIHSAIEMLLDTGIISLSEVFLILLELEGWGNQQIFLYKFKGGEALREQWLDGDRVKDCLTKAGLGDIYNSTRPLPEIKDRRLFTVRHDREKGRIRFVWVEHVTTTRWEKSIPDDPKSDFKIIASGSKMERLILRTYRESIVRGITSFEWNIRSCEAMVMIRKLRRTKYATERNTIVNELAKALPISDFRPLSISKLINNLDDIPDVIREKIRYRALSDPETKISYETGYKKDLFANPIIQEHRQAYQSGVTGDSNFSRWKIGRNKCVGIDLCAERENDHRIGIPSQQSEEDVRRVLQRIRPHCE